MELWQLQQRQSLPLEAKINHSKRIIREFGNYFDWNVYISVSGGIDSKVLEHLVRSVNPRVTAAFINTRLEFPENVQIIKDTENVTWLKPKMNYFEVVNKYGWPFPNKEQAGYLHELKTTKSEKLRNIRLNGRENGLGKVCNKWLPLIDSPYNFSDQCCDILKKNPVKKFEKETGFLPFIGTLAEESNQRKTQYIRNGGCNFYDAKRPTSRPLSIWTKQDIWDYIQYYNLSYSKIYDKGETQTGCILCLFGIAQEEEPNRLQRLKIYNPKLYEFGISDCGIGELLDYLGIPYK